MPVSRGRSVGQEKNPELFEWRWTAARVIRHPDAIKKKQLGRLVSDLVSDSLTMQPRHSGNYGRIGEGE